MAFRNALLFHEIADKIEVNPELYYQRDWASYVVTAIGDEALATPEHTRHLQTNHQTCGTAFCIAGWAAHLSGVEPKRTSVSRPAGVEWWVITERIASGHWIDPEGQAITNIASWARGILGLGDSEAAVLFASEWQPRHGLTVPEALRALGAGAHIWDVTRIRTCLLQILPMPAADPLPIAEVRAMAEAWRDPS